ncbi:MAG: DUF86 domain-containing protein [Flavobacteriaceae bacterium]|nr:DUF86 domain-containing protein [Flavobacteriaceae bacterium]MCY4268159.1 DUF86 domain-containing protein [Flavobacteriaceae bacterium]MCY4298154.1 DUF86 domain-containing protein [Flavobacteriaceae bacterium]
MTNEVKHAFPEIPWGKIEKMRHRLVHECHDADLELVWNTATDSVPEFEKSLDAIATFIKAKKDQDKGTELT